MSEKEMKEAKNTQDEIFKLLHRVGTAQITYLTMQHKEEGKFEAACALADCVPDLLSLIENFSECLTIKNEAIEAGLKEAIESLEAENLALQERAQELEKQNDFFLKALKENFMCPYSRCKHDYGSELDEWECDAENNRECWTQAALERC